MTVEMKYKRLMNADPSVGDTVAIITPMDDEAKFSVTYGVVSYVTKNVIDMTDTVSVTKEMEDVVDRDYADTLRFNRRLNPYALLYHLVPVDRKK
jgi:hypothetical protein